MRRLPQLLAAGVAALALAWACPFNDTLREYLNAQFWLPFARLPYSFERPNVQRADAPFAGMAAADGTSAIARLRAAYQQIAVPIDEEFDTAPLEALLAAARATPGLNPRQREELDLIDAKIDLRAGHVNRPQRLRSARSKFEAFLRHARTPELLSEARGWLARVHYLLGDQTAAGKIYLDELNRAGSNLSRDTLLASLHMTYGYDGGKQLLAHLDEYFDTPEHAIFAIQLVSNPHSNREWLYEHSAWPRPNCHDFPYARIQRLLEKHSRLFAATHGSALLQLGMRTALRGGNPAAALRLAEAVPADTVPRRDPDVLWMLASARFLTRDYGGAEVPLLELFGTLPDRDSRKAAAAYGLCGVYQKLARHLDQLRYAFWLYRAAEQAENAGRDVPRAGDLSVYWAASGWDLKLLLETEASIEELQAFIAESPQWPHIRIVRYALAVRLSRENRYVEAARVYEEIHATVRAPRLRRLAELALEAERSDLPSEPRLQARYRLARFLSENSNRVYFNDSLWGGLQRYALIAEKDARYTRAEHEEALARERKLKDDQEELWRAYLILRQVAVDTANPALRHQAATLGVRCLRSLSDRFGREVEIRRADMELSALLRPRSQTGPER